MTLAEGQQFVGNAVRKALHVADIKHDAAAAMIGVSATHFSKQLRGEEHLSVQRLTQIEDRVFWFVLLVEFRTQFQVTDTTTPEIAAALHQLMGSIARQMAVQHRRMAKASLPEGVTERRRRTA